MPIQSYRRGMPVANRRDPLDLGTVQPGEVLDDDEEESDGSEIVEDSDEDSSV